MAALVVDPDGVIMHCSRAAADVLGYDIGELCGNTADSLLTAVSNHWGEWSAVPTQWTELPREGRARVRRHSGEDLEVAFQTVSIGEPARCLILAVPIEQARSNNQSLAFTRALFDQHILGVAFLDHDLRIVQTNMSQGVLGGPLTPQNAQLGDLLATRDAERLEEQLRSVAKTGVPLVRVERALRSTAATPQNMVVSLSAFPLEGGDAQPDGVAVLVADISGEHRAHHRLALLHEAAIRIGGSLNVTQTAQDFANVLVPALGDLATIDLADAVLVGEEPPRLVGSEGGLHRVAGASVDGRWPAEMLPPGEPCPPMQDLPELRIVQRGETMVTLSVQEEGFGGLEGHPELQRLFVPPDGHSVMNAPLYARGLLLGVASVWRIGESPPFDEDDSPILNEIASRAALSVDNARRYTREHRAAVALQRSLLPRASTNTAAAETAGAYLPATGGAGLGGDWFDVIPLSSLREAFVVGDVVGHGLRASATMGRLRSAVQTLADLDLGPDEVLTHLDDHIQRFAAESGRRDSDDYGATCLYTVYDPVTRRCVLASAGHPPPAVVWPDGSVEFVDMTPGPPLGVGSMPFEVTELELPPGSVLALYTDGLIERDDRDVVRGMARLRDWLADTTRLDAPLPEAVAELIAVDPQAPPLTDDTAVLLARVNAVATQNVATWTFPADPAAVANAREVTARQLADWGLDDLAFTTELVVSELVTNAVRYAGAPVGLRLIRDRALVCEVSDPSNTQPRMRRALMTDEGGRGLFLVAQLTSRWGSRYGREGKTIWTEQSCAEDHIPAADPLFLGGDLDPFPE